MIFIIAFSFYFKLKKHMQMQNLVKCVKCRLENNDIIWHYNEMPDEQYSKEIFLIRYYGGYGNLNYEFAKLIPIDQSKFKQFTNNKNTLIFKLLDKTEIELTLSQIHSWMYKIELIKAIDDKL